MCRVCDETGYAHAHTRAHTPVFRCFDQLHAERIIMQVVSRSRGLKIVGINGSSVAVEVDATHRCFPSTLAVDGLLGGSWGAPGWVRPLPRFDAEVFHYF